MLTLEGQIPGRAACGEHRALLRSTVKGACWARVPRTLGGGVDSIGCTVAIGPTILSILRARIYHMPF